MGRWYRFHKMNKSRRIHGICLELDNDQKKILWYVWSLGLVFWKYFLTIVQFSCRRSRTFSRSKPSRRLNRPVPERLNDSLSACDAASRLFSNAFDELCAWLFDLLEGGTLVPMTELSIEYERICQRRNETCTESMLRTSHLRQRLECKYGDDLHFDKISNHEVEYSLL